MSCTLLCCIVLHCAVMFFTVLACTLICFTALYSAVLYLTVFSCTLLCCVVLCCALLYFTKLSCTLLCSPVLYCAVLYFTVLYYTLLCCPVLYCSALYFIVLSCTLLCCPVLYDSHSVLFCTFLYCIGFFRIELTVMFISFTSQNQFSLGISGKFLSADQWCALHYAHYMALCSTVQCTKPCVQYGQEYSLVEAGCALCSAQFYPQFLPC